MFMQFVGGGIGHQANDHTDCTQQRTPIHNCNKAPDLYDNLEDIIPCYTQGHTEMEGDIYAAGDPEELDTDKEADYGYIDHSESEGRDSEGEDSEGKEGNDDDEDEEL
jgi:hypothetical protein